jgi:hypothetical protein
LENVQHRHIAHKKDINQQLAVTQRPAQFCADIHG